jgi:UDP-N-acetylglucosamine 2-epimerase (non-hydrolysing)/UDP-GlcNAc3NAcA epimerase
MKIVTVVGARPQFIKAAAVSRILRIEFEEILVHTGQHYDTNMSDIFFDELEIPHPDYNLGVGSGSHGKQTAEMLSGIEEILLKEKPDFLLVYGDTNSTLAGALAASKLNLPVIHVEAGLRSFNKRMPEEQNRILTDHVSEILFCPTETASTNLKNENIIKNVYVTGDVMCDAVLYYSQQMEQFTLEQQIGQLHCWYGEPEKLSQGWYLSTIHRAENTDDVLKIEEILAALEKLSYPVIFPVHPRTKGMVSELCKKYFYTNIICVDPIGYKEMLYFTKNAQKIITDSGGLQKEAYILHIPCITVRDQTEWVETLQGNHNVLTKPCKSDILEKVVKLSPDSGNHPNYYGDGKAAEKICKIIGEYKK